MKKALRSIGFALVLGTLLPALPACGGGADTGDEQDQTASAGRFETFIGEDGQHYFQLLAGNGERVLRSEAYKTLASAKKGIASVKKNGQLESSFEVLEAESGESYFNLVASNGQIIGTSETYASKSNASRAVKTVMKIVTNATDASAQTGTASFETFKGQDGQAYFRLSAKNGEIVLQSEGYSSTSGAKKGIESVQKSGVDASNYQVLEGQNGQYYFRIVASNGQVIGRGEMYASQSNATRGADTVRKIIRDLAGAGPVSDAEIKAEIEKAADGLTYMSESDYPFTFVKADLGSGDKDINEAMVREKLASYVDSDPDTDKPLSELFAMTGTWEEWQSSDADCSDADNDADAKAMCLKMRNLDTVLGANLTGIKVFYFGSNGEPGHVDGVAVSILVVGRTPSGNLAGVRTIAIWT